MNKSKKWHECEQCEKKLSSYKSLWRHKKTCKSNVAYTTTLDNQFHIRSTEQDNWNPNNKDSEFNAYIDGIINGSASSNQYNAQDKQLLSKGLTASSFEESKHRKLRKFDDDYKTLNNLKKQKLTLPIVGQFGDSNDENEDNSDYIVGNNRESESQTKNEEVEDLGEENSDYDVDNDSEDSDNHQTIPLEDMKEEHLYCSRNNLMNVYELDIPADRSLTNLDLCRYKNILKIPKFRGVFMANKLPERVNSVECGIINFDTYDQFYSHWVCYAKIHNTCIYFDSFGRKTPLEVQKYLKTNREYISSTPMIQRNTDIVQKVNTRVCGHLCLFVLTSIMREHLLYQQVMDQLNDGYSQNYW